MMAISENLLTHARNGDDSALGELLESYRRYLALLARPEIGRHLQKKVDPEDLVQETFVEAHRNFSTFSGSTEAELACWLRRILARNVTDVIRHYLGTKKRDARSERDIQEAVDRSSVLISQVSKGPPQSSPSQRAARAERAVIVADALASLPGPYAEVIVLRLVEDLSWSEIAERMGKKVSHVKMTLFPRAVAMLGPKLEKLA